MFYRKSLPTLVAFLVLFLFLQGAVWSDAPEPRELDVPYEPSHPAVVRAMLKLAKVNENDIHYDLGCGDGGIVIHAVRKYGCRAVCVDISKQRLEEAKEKAKQYGVYNRITFINGDIFDQNISKATVVSIYLLNSVNRKLRPRLFRFLKPGVRVVSHAFHMGEWKPDKKIRHKRARRNSIYLWIIPASVRGSWRWSNPGSTSMRLRQEFQEVSGSIRFPAGQSEISEARLRGSSLIMHATTRDGGRTAHVEYRGEVQRNVIKGHQIWRRSRNGRPYRTLPWNARR